ncbi:MAG: helix-turn-helix transcriptional regulator [Vicinamibacteria bacterium]
MTARRSQSGPPTIELDGRRYVVLRETEYERLLASAREPADSGGGWAAWEQDAARLAERLAERRRDAGLTQTALARAAGLRVETLNRIERGHQSPDFATVRKLVAALGAARAPGSGTSQRKGGGSR